MSNKQKNSGDKKFIAFQESNNSDKMIMDRIGYGKLKGIQKIPVATNKKNNVKAKKLQTINLKLNDENKEL